MPGIWSTVDQADDPQAAVVWQKAMAGWPVCQKYKRKSIRLLQLKPGDSVLDLGCGPGMDLLALSKEVGPGGRVSGLDSSSAMIEEAARVNCQANVDIQVGDAAHLPFQPSTFDAVRADRLFQHLSEPEKVLSEVIRVIKPGGRLVIVDPDQDTLEIRLAPLPETCADTGRITEMIRQFRRSHPTNPTIAGRMPQLFAQLGLTEIEMEPVAMVLTDPRDAFGLLQWPDMLQAEGRLKEEEVLVWKTALERAVQKGTFSYCVSLFISSATKPGLRQFT